MKKLIVATIGLGFGFSVGPVSADTLLFSDNFNTPTALPQSINPGSYDSVDQTPYQSGTLATALAVRSGNNAMGTTGISGTPSGVGTGFRSLRFQEELPVYGNAYGDGTQTAPRYDWAAALSAGNLLRVSYDANFTSGTGYGFSFGVTNSAAGVASSLATTDVSVRFDADGTARYWNSGVVSSNSTFTAPTGFQTITIELGYTGVTEGSALTLSGWVGGTQIYNNVTGFTWDNITADGGGIYFIMDSNAGGAGSLRQIDNLQISLVSTPVPEPSMVSAALAGFAGLIVVCRQRRRYLNRHAV